MKKMTLKGICSVLAMTMLMSVLIGCSQQKPGNEAAASNSGGSSTPSGDPVVLTVEVFDRGVQDQSPADNNYWTRYVQENFGKPNNIDVRFITVPRSEEVAKLNVLMASNSAPDIAFTYSQPTIYNYVKNGGLTDLGPLINEHGPDLKKFLGDELLAYGLINGQQYVIPAKSTSPTPTNMTFIRQDWLDQVNLPVPTNVDELYTTLKAFKEQIKGTDGKEIIPFGISGSGENGNGPSPDIVRSFREEMSEEDFYAMYGFTTYFAMPGIKEGFRFFNKLYNEGLISKDFPLDKDGKILESGISSGNVGAFEINQYMVFSEGKSYETLLNGHPGAAVAPFKPFVDYQGKQSKAATLPIGIYSFVPKSSKRAVEAVKYLNWLSKPEVLSFMQNGEEGIHHTIVDGLPVAKTDVPNDKKMYVSNNLDYTPIVNGVAYDTLEDVLKVRSQTATIKGAEQLFVDSIMLSNNDSYKPPFFSVPIESEIKYQALLTTKASEITTRSVIAAPEDFDKVYDGLLKELLDNGAQQIIDERRAAYKAMQK